MNHWHLDIHAANRADAIGQIRRSPLPPIASEYLAGLVAGENYVWCGRINPDVPLHVWGSGYDHGSYIGIDRSGLEYERTANTNVDNKK